MAHPPAFNTKTFINPVRPIHNDPVVTVGKVRPKAVKKIARELLEAYPDAFTTDFEANKQFIKEHVDIKAKRLRNRVAGYIVRLVKRRMREAERG